ncbi:hypothetical protein LTR70_010569 [Exophiala xenobiotica]|uniref:Uncharacterized protein n=1 Tax=Lithohypha guttulata TaxID=1690604 RepID=A0ABR0JTZ5_9EURO|nr:hypothetical protein LTR24_010544 [Lithohypha guttulata]KAK5309148.1 hypothetical protein LTR70_010569 [Exophiala xenobiotica]
MAPETNDPPPPPSSPQCIESTGKPADNSVDHVVKELCIRFYGYGDLPRVKGSPVSTEDYVPGRSYEYMTQAIYGVAKEDNEDTHVRVTDSSLGSTQGRPTTAFVFWTSANNFLRHFGQQAKKLKIAQSSEDCKMPKDKSSVMDIHRHELTGQKAEIEVDSDEDWQEDEAWCDRVMEQVRRAGEI